MLFSLQSFLDEEDISRYDFLQNTTKRCHFINNVKYHHVIAILTAKMKTNRLFINRYSDASLYNYKDYCGLFYFKGETILNIHALMIIYLYVYL